MADWRRVQEIFGEALDVPAGERAAFLVRACGEDAALLAEVESLLRHHERSGEGFMRPPERGGREGIPAGAGAREDSRTSGSDRRGDSRTSDRIAEAVGGDRSQTGPIPAGSGHVDGVREAGSDPLVGCDVGGYRVERVIASGGMGTVYLVEQRQPHRAVALKLLRAGIASQSALRRFEYESEILARMRHPNTAEVYEAGTHLGLPYFVMEYIAGSLPITAYAAGREFSQRERLRLFEQVCEAVHYGHQRGVIHRDLKPGNILVDGDGRVRVIDFGVARATDADITLTTLHTATGEMVGTLQYMSPEQCDGDPHEIDVRSDVYSLGVVLYELLCGRLPYSVANLAVASAARVICEQAPARPSGVTGRKTRPRANEGRDRAGPGNAAIKPEGASAHSHGREPVVPDTPKDRAPVRGDLERIVLKALEKDRRQRYQSAADLLRDVRHYLNREPIEAKPPTVWTRAVRWVVRHPVWVTTAACLAVAAVILVGMLQSVWSLNRTPHQVVLYDRLGAPIRANEPAAEARLLTRIGGVLENWRTRDSGVISGGYFLDRPTEFGGGELVILAFSGASTEYPSYGNALVAFDPANGLDSPEWIGGVTRQDALPVPSYAPDRIYTPRQFNAIALGAWDIFDDPNHPGTEIVVAFRHSSRSQIILRIYDLAGHVLYQVWHDGTIAGAYWMSEARLLVCHGTNGVKRWSEWGRPEVEKDHPRVVFAIRPKANCIQTDFLADTPGEGVLDPLWYSWLAPPEVLGSFEHVVLLSLEAPDFCEPGKAVALHLRFFDMGGGNRGGLAWDVDADGRMIPDTRFPSDRYLSIRNTLEPNDSAPLPDPNEFRLVPWPPTPSDSDRSAADEG